jgi:sarcosine oxidase delta subunit
MARKLEFEISGKSNVDPAVNKAKASIDSLGERMKKAFDFKGAMTSAFLNAFGASMLLSKAINTVTEGFKELAKIEDEQAKSGMGAEDFQRLAFVANDAGVSLGTLSKSIRELKKFMREALDDTDKMRILTDGLGMSFDEVKKGDPMTVMKAMSKVMSQYASDVDRATIATALLSDKTANEMLPVFDELKRGGALEGLNVVNERTLREVGDAERAWSKFYNNIKVFSAKNILMPLMDPGAPDRMAELQQRYRAETGKSGFAGGFLSTETTQEFEEWLKNSTSKTEQKSISEQQAKANLDVFKKQNDLSAEKKNTFSPDQGPTGGVIGVGNNAQTLLMAEQVDLLKRIAEAVSRGSSVVTTDFTKPEFVPHSQLKFK